jgi:hypothetical protein
MADSPPSHNDAWKVFRRDTVARLKADAAFEPALKGGRHNAAQKQAGVLWEALKASMGVSPAKSVSVYAYRTEPALGGLLWEAVKALEPEDDGEGYQLREE